MSLKKIFGAGIIGLLIIAMVSISIIPVQASTELKATSYNLNTLQNFPSYAYLSGRLNWMYGYQLDATYERAIIPTYYMQHADNNGYLWGECVSSCKALSKDNRGTSNWIKGRQVIGNNVPAGRVIATFFGSGETYSGHAAILKSYQGDSIEVWDQNWYYLDLNQNGRRDSGEGIFGKHSISRYGSGVCDADNYYVVEV